LASNFIFKIYNSSTSILSSIIIPLKTFFRTNPVPRNILSDLSPGGYSEYLILLPGPSAEIVFDDIHNDIKWGRLYDNEDGSYTDPYIYPCPSKLSCEYVKSYYPKTINTGRGYIFGTSGSFDLTINVYYRILNKITNKKSDLYHIYYDAQCKINSDPLYLKGEGEARTYGTNFIVFPGERTYIPPRIMVCLPPVIIAGIV
jgi:hypothetical protein